MTTPRKITLERTFQATVEEVWELWTTPAGIESWWGPEGFRVAVRGLDLRPGGELAYAMIAVAPEMKAFMVQAGMPTTTEHKVAYTEVAAPTRLAWSDEVDFVQGVGPYRVAVELTLREIDRGVKLVLTFDAMHDDLWTERSVMGREMELAKLARLLEK